MKKIALALSLAFAAQLSVAADMTEEQKTFYALGLAMGQQASVFSMTPAELELVKKGLSDAVTGAKPAVELEQYGPKLQPLAQARRAAQGEKAAAEGKAFADKAAKEKGAVKTASGLVYLSVKDGSGQAPGADDTVKVHYRGTLPNGKEFDSSYKRGEPIEFPLSGVIKCWGEGVQKMKVGGKAKLVCPPSIAYGENGAGAAIPPNATLAFEVELLGVTKAAAPAASAPAAKPAAKPEAKK